MDVKEIHKWIDLCDSLDPTIKAEAEVIVDAWNKDIKPSQMWRMKEQDSVVCTILSIGKKICVEVESFSDNKGSGAKVAYFGKKSFFDKWERMF